MTNWPDHLSKFRPESLAVKETEHWVVTARPKQVTLGSCVILLKREEPSVAGLTADEAVDFVTAVSWFEGALATFSSPDRFNYVAAMMKDPFVHFHAFPRYESERTWHDRTWSDPCWPAVIEFRDVETSAEDLEALRKELTS